MNALNALANRRIDILRVSQKRFTRRSFFILLLVMVTIGGMLSLRYALWIIPGTVVVSKAVNDPQYPQNGLRMAAPNDALLGQIFPFHIANATELSQRVAQTRAITSVYDDLPNVAQECKGWRESDTLAISSSRADVGETGHVQMLLVPLACSADLDENLGRVLASIDSDPSAAGSTFVWILPNSERTNGLYKEELNLRHRQAPERHMIYPEDFLILEEQITPTHTKSNSVWREGMDETLLSVSEFCVFSRNTSAQVLSIYVNTNCIPIIEPSTRLPLERLLLWEPAILRLSDLSRAEALVDDVDGHSRNFKRRVLSAISKGLSSLSKSDAILYNLAFR